jgi:c-di-AMP phosphodiesterase-like protein
VIANLAWVALLLMAHWYRNATWFSTIYKRYVTYVYQQLTDRFVLFLEQITFSWESKKKYVIITFQTKENKNAHHRHTYSNGIAVPADLRIT